MSVTYQLSGMHCGACVAKVTKALQPLAGAVTVSLNPQEVSIESSSVSLPDLQAALSAIGKYEISAFAAPMVVDQRPGNFLKESVSAKPAEPGSTWLRTYYPLLLIALFIFAASVLVQLGHSTAPALSVSALSASETMRYFMAGFFLVFSFFKLLDLKAFANAYQSYDLLAQKWPTWGMIYPFVELALGAAYLANWMPVLTNVVTLVVMGFSAIGVIRAVLSKSQIQCACLGTVFKLPMSTVTIVEDLGMVAMAVAMLLSGNH
jgi:copper chaperone CopZ